MPRFRANIRACKKFCVEENLSPLLLFPMPTPTPQRGYIKFSTCIFASYLFDSSYLLYSNNMPYDYLQLRLFNRMFTCYYFLLLLLVIARTFWELCIIYYEWFILLDGCCVILLVDVLLNLLLLFFVELLPILNCCYYWEAVMYQPEVLILFWLTLLLFEVRSPAAIVGERDAGARLNYLCLRLDAPFLSFQPLMFNFWQYYNSYLLLKNELAKCK